MSTRLLAFIAAPAILMAACSSSFTSGSDESLDESDAGDGSGGVSDGGAGSSGSGGTLAGTGGRGVGGASPASGGKPSATGGRVGAGGAPQAGGAPEAGGATSDGGDTGNGGSTVGTGGTNGAGGAINPPPIPTTGLLLWLRADVGVTQQQSARVSKWADQSGQHADAVQEFPELRPTFTPGALNGKPGLAFDGVDDYLELPAGFSDFSNGLTFFAVAQSIDDGDDGCRGIFEASNGPEVDDVHVGRHGGELQYEVLDEALRAGTFLPGEPSRLSVLHYPDTGLQIGQADGAFVVTNMSLPVVVERELAYVGRTLYNACPTWGGYIGELLLYDRALTADEYDSVDLYLAGRWKN